MKKITTLFLTLACLAITANATVTINVRTSTGEAPYLYVWDGAGTALNDAWPGTLMDETQTYITAIDGKVWLTQSFDEDAINIIFNDGGDPITKTSDIMGVTGTAFFTFDFEIHLAVEHLFASREAEEQEQIICDNCFLH